VPSSIVHTTSRYDPIAITLHWLIAIALIAQVSLGWLMQQVPKQPPGPRAAWFNLHKSIGLTLGALIVARLIWRLTHRPPPLPASLPRWQTFSAPALHRILYIAMLAMPLSGYFGSIYSGHPVRYFGVGLPSWGAQDDALKNLFSTIHFVAAWTLIALFAGHVTAALSHLVSRDGIFRRMWPSARGAGSRPNL
jgi:cytochrome b561